MALADIKKSILDEGRQQAKAIEQEGERKNRALRQQWRDKVDAKKAEILAMARRKANQKIQQSHFKVQSQSQAEILQRKKQIIDQAYEKTLTKLKNLDDEQYVELMTKLIEKLPATDGELISVEGKESLLKKALSKSRGKYQLSKETIKGSGGFKFTSAEIDINNTFRSLIEAVKDQTALVVAETLFNQEEKK